MAMAIFWQTTTNTIMILWLLSHSEPIELFRIIFFHFATLSCSHFSATAANIRPAGYIDIDKEEEEEEEEEKGGKKESKIGLCNQLSWSTRRIEVDGRRWAKGC